MTKALAAPLALLRRLVGLIFLAIGILGLLLPILPGWPFIIPAIVLLGRRDRTLRLTHLLVRRTLRALRRSRNPVLQRVGRRLSLEYVRTRRIVVPAINATERAFARAWFSFSPEEA
jgi:hypothetical protein